MRPIENSKICTEFHMSVELFPFMIGVGERGQGRGTYKSGKYFSGRYYVKLGNFAGNNHVEFWHTQM